MSEYIVYMHKNKANGKRYIGITHHTEDPNRRWLNGRGYFKNKHFSDAIKKYGWDGFDHIVLERGLAKKEACMIEQNLISQYRTQDKKYGYNITSGGECFKHSEKTKALMSERRKGKGLHEFSEEHKRKIREHHNGGAEKKKVVCVETGKIYESINDAARDVGISKKVISSCCRKIPHFLTAKGYHWKFAESEV